MKHTYKGLDASNWYHLTTVVEVLSILSSSPVDWSYTAQILRVGASGTVRKRDSMLIQ